MTGDLGDTTFFRKVWVSSIIGIPYLVKPAAFLAKTSADSTLESE
jgi:hypothetical protein